MIRPAPGPAARWWVPPVKRRILCTAAIVITVVAVHRVRPGSTILLHAMYQTAALAAISRIVTELRSRGYDFVTVLQPIAGSELAGM